MLELGVVSALWSEHCSYKSSRRLLSGFMTDGPRVLQGPGENAGVVDLGDGWAVAFKMESHNHPSFIEPYQGAATGVGGIMRDVFTMGARPIASLNALRFGDPHDPKHSRKTRSLVHGVVAGIGDYGNCMGVPMVGGETWFHSSYNQNNLVNAFNLGLLKSDEIFRGYAEGIGNPVLYVGSKTGRDGIHGASMASDSFSADGGDQRPTVQAGDPFQEKKLLEACLELMQSGCIVGIQDMGAAGLTSSAFEMAERAGNGLRMDLSKVPTREPEMTPYELMLSESQERMLMVLTEGTEHIAQKIFSKWGLDVATIGEVVDGDAIELYWGDDHLTTLPIELAVSGFATPHREKGQPPVPHQADSIEIDPVHNWQEMLEGWMAHPNQASKRWIWEQYDSSVQAATVRGPGAECAVVAPPEIAPKGVAMTADCPSRYVAADPYQGGQHTVAGAIRNLACVGAEPIGMTDCLNFGNPEKPAVYGTFAEAIRGVSDAGRAADVAVVSGNVSLYNETDAEGVYPTPEIGMVGLIPEVAEQPAPLAAGDVIMMLGDFNPVWGGSQYALDQIGAPVGPLPALAWEVELGIASFVRGLVRDGKVLDAKDVGSGGIVTSLLQLLFRHDRLGLSGGKEDVAKYAPTIEQALLGETTSTYLIAISASDVAAIETEAKTAGVSCCSLGVVVSATNEGPAVLELGELRLNIAPIYDAWDDGLTQWVHADA